MTLTGDLPATVLVRDAEAFLLQWLYHAEDHATISTLMSDADGTPAALPREQTVETRGERARRHVRRGGLYATAFVMAALVVAIVALVTANMRRVEVSWVVGSATQSLAWIVVVTALLGWLLGIVTSVLFRRRTRAPRT